MSALIGALLFALTLPGVNLVVAGGIVLFIIALAFLQTWMTDEIEQWSIMLRNKYYCLRLKRRVAYG